MFRVLSTPVDKVGSKKPLASKSYVSCRIDRLLISQTNLQAGQRGCRCKRALVCRVIFALAKRRFQIFPLFQACVGNFHTIRPWKVVGTRNVDSSYVTFKCFAFLSICDKFEFLGHVQVTTMIWVLFLSLFLNLSLVTVSVNLLLQPFLLDYFGQLVTSTFLLCTFRGLPGSTPVSFPFISRWKSRWNLRDRLS